MKNPRQLRQSQASRTIHCIQSKDGTLLKDPVKINKCLAEFYTSVYQSQGEPDLETMDMFWVNLNLPKLSKDSINVLDADINLDEINLFLPRKQGGRSRWL